MARRWELDMTSALGHVLSRTFEILVFMHASCAEDKHKTVGVRWLGPAVIFTHIVVRIIDKVPSDLALA